MKRPLHFIANYFEEILASVIMLAMLALTFTNVIFRFFLTASISFTEEITCALFILLAMLGTAIAAKHQAHLGLSLITERLGPKARGVVAFAGNILGALFSFILLYSGIGMAHDQYVLKMITISLQWPEWIYGSFLPFGAFFMLVRFLQAAVMSLKTLKEALEQ